MIIFCRPTQIMKLVPYFQFSGNTVFNNRITRLFDHMSKTTNQNTEYKYKLGFVIVLQVNNVSAIFLSHISF